MARPLPHPLHRTRAHKVYDDSTAEKLTLTALECGEDGCLMPTWSAQPNPSVLGATAAPAAGGASSSDDRLRFRQVAASIGSSGQLLGKWAGAKSVAVVGKVVPGPVKKLAIRVAANRAKA